MNRKKLSPIWIVIFLLIISNIVSGRFADPGQWIMSKLMMLPAILIGLCFHEFAHGAVSYMLGDPTPKLQGRLTLNPLAHIDFFGFFALIFAGFGWGKPVEIDPRYYKHRRRDEFLVAAAGVTMNLILAVLFAIIIKVIFMVNPMFMAGRLGAIIIEILRNIIFINIVLMVFNLLPVPPLDGFGICSEIFNLRKYSWYYTLYNYGGLILMALVLFNITGLILSPIVGSIYSLIVNTIIF